MTIGFDASRAFVEGRTGTENYSFQLLKNLSEIDTKNQYLIYIRPNTKYKIPNTDWPENFKFVEIPLPRLWTQLGLASRTFIDPLDVLFIPSHTLPLIRRPGLKTVLTVHDLGAEYLPGMHQVKQVLYLNLMTHYQLKTATKVIAVSQATKDDIIKRVGVPSKKIEVIYEGVDKTVFKRSLRSSASPAVLKPIPKDIVNDIVKKYDLVCGKYFLFVGTIQPRKNLQTLIRAFYEFVWGPVDPQPHSTASFTSSVQALNGAPRVSPPIKTDFQLVLVGQKGWKSEPIYKLPKELGIEPQVRFLGRIPDSDLVGLYNGALALTYPSLFEGFGLPIIEAFACGCPVITSNISAMREVAGPAGLLVDPYNKEEIAEAMQRILNNAFRDNLIHKGYNRLKDFDWQKTAKETVKIFDELRNSK